MMPAKWQNKQLLQTIVLHKNIENYAEMVKIKFFRTLERYQRFMLSKIIVDKKRQFRRHQESLWCFYF